MDAMLDEKLDVDGFWAAYVGNQSPQEFMNRSYSPEIDACVAEYVEGLPAVFGIVRRQTWRDSFSAPWQFRRGEVAAALTQKLEATEAEWRPHLKQRPRPEPSAPVELPPMPMNDLPVSETPNDVDAKDEISESPGDGHDLPTSDVPSAAPELDAETLNLHEEQAAGQDEVEIAQAEETREPME